MVKVVVERSFDEPLDPALLAQMAEGGGWCFRQHAVRLLRSFLAGDGRRMVCLFEAPDAEAVRTTQRQLSLPVESVWTAEVIEAPVQPPAGSTESGK